MASPVDGMSVIKAMMQAIDRAIEWRVENFAPKLKAWLEAVLNSPIPKNWRDELASFVERTSGRSVDEDHPLERRRSADFR